MSELLEKKDDLIRYFDGTAHPYSGAGGDEDLLRQMATDYGFEPDDEHGHILALKGERSAITLEPGGQIELSGEQCESIHCAYDEFSTHVQQLIEVTSQIGATVLGLGM